jgi:hypothetical protein
MSGGGSKNQPAASVGSAETGSGSAAVVAKPTGTDIGSATTASAMGSASSAGSAILGSAASSTAIETGSASVQTDAHSKPKPDATKHHIDKTVKHTGDKTVPHVVETPVKTENPKPPDPPKAGSAALPF